MKPLLTIALTVVLALGAVPLQAATTGTSAPKAAPTGAAAAPAPAQVAEERAAVLGADDVRSMLTEALKPRMSPGRIEVNLDNPTLELRVAAGRADAVRVELLNYAPVQARFTATLSVAGEDGQTRRVTVAGRAASMVEVPVVARRVAPNETISSGDIAWIEVRADQAPNDLVTTEAQLVGQTARRTLVANTAVRLRDIQAPRLVNKGSLVTMVLQTPNLMVTAQGRALQEGGVGDVIRVVNTQSNRIVEATVSGPGTVAVARPGATLVN